MQIRVLQYDPDQERLLSVRSFLHSPEIWCIAPSATSEDLFLTVWSKGACMLCWNAGQCGNCLSASCLVFVNSVKYTHVKQFAWDVVVRQPRPDPCRSRQLWHQPLEGPGQRFLASGSAVGGPHQQNPQVWCHARSPRLGKLSTSATFSKPH